MITEKMNFDFEILIDGLLSSWNVHFLLIVSRIDIEISIKFQILILHYIESMWSNFPFLYKLIDQLNDPPVQL